jgi:hypothetical protein
MAFSLCFSLIYHFFFPFQFNSFSDGNSQNNGNNRNVKNEKTSFSEGINKKVDVPLLFSSGFLGKRGTNRAFSAKKRESSQIPLFLITKMKAKVNKSEAANKYKTLENELFVGYPVVFGTSFVKPNLHLKITSRIIIKFFFIIIII